MNYCNKSHSSSAMPRKRQTDIQSLSVIRRTPSRRTAPKCQPLTLVFHPLHQKLCDASRRFSDIHVQCFAEVAVLPEEYITTLAIPSKEDESRNSASTVRDSQKQLPEPGLSKNSTFIMSSRRSGHSSNSKSSSRRTHTSHYSTSQLIDTLNTRRINTLTELRRIERIAADSSPSTQLAFQSPMTSAWNHYVSSNNFLGELRGLTRSYPFSSAMLDDAKWRVQNDPESNRSWNFAWLCLRKLIDDQMIPIWAASEAEQPEMWGGRSPEQSDIDQLAACFAYEWNEAVETMLRHWESPPTTTGY